MIGASSLHREAYRSNGRRIFRARARTSVVSRPPVESLSRENPVRAQPTFAAQVMERAGAADAHAGAYAAADDPFDSPAVVQRSPADRELFWQMEVRAEYLNDLRQDLGPGDANPIDEMLKRMLRSEKRPVQIINPRLQQAGTCIFEQYLWNRKEDGMVDIARFQGCPPGTHKLTRLQEMHPVRLKSTKTNSAHSSNNCYMYSYCERCGVCGFFNAVILNADSNPMLQLSPDTQPMKEMHQGLQQLKDESKALNEQMQGLKQQLKDEIKQRIENQRKFWDIRKTVNEDQKKQEQRLQQLEGRVEEQQGIKKLWDEVKLLKDCHEVHDQRLQRIQEGPGTAVTSADWTRLEALYATLSTKLQRVDATVEQLKLKETTVAQAALNDLETRVYHHIQNTVIPNVLSRAMYLHPNGMRIIPNPPPSAPRPTATTATATIRDGSSTSKGAVSLASTQSIFSTGSASTGLEIRGQQGGHKRARQ